MSKEPLTRKGLVLVSEREKQWKESNDFLKTQISDLQQQLAEFKNDVVNEIKRCQQPPCFAHQSSYKGKVHDTNSVFYVGSQMVPKQT